MQLQEVASTLSTDISTAGAERNRFKEEYLYGHNKWRVKVCILS